ncbi:MAG: CHAT domain-containing protein [Acidobacteriota bacterium]
MFLVTGIVAAQEQTAYKLVQDLPVERELSDDNSHLYQITLNTGQYMHLRVEWMGSDLLAILLDPNGRQLIRIDNIERAQGPDSISIIAEVSGSYWLEVQQRENSLVKKHYRVRIVALRAVAPQDQSMIVAEKAFMEGRQLHRQGIAESSQRAIEKYQEALSIWRSLREQARVADALYNISLVYNSLSEYQQGLDYSKQALLIRHTLGDRSGEAAALNNIGVIYAFLGDYAKALKYYREALLLRRAIEDLIGEAITLTKIGWLYTVAFNQPKRALEYYNSSLVLRRALADRKGEAETLSHIGLVYTSLDNHQKALEYYNQSLVLRRAEADRSGEAYALASIGWAHYSLGEWQYARKCFIEALTIRQAMQDRARESGLYYAIAHTERRLGNVYEAKTLIEQAINIVDSMRTKITSKDLRATYRASKNRFYDFYIDLLMDLHTRHPSEGFAQLAFEASEQARSRSLLEILGETKVNFRQGVDLRLLEREIRLGEQLNAMEQTRLQLNGKLTEEQIATIEKQTEALLVDYQELQEQIRQSGSRYAELIDPTPLKLREIQQQILDDETILLQYTLGNRRSFLWAVTSTAITSYQLPKKTEIEAAARRVYKLLTVSHKRETKRQAELAVAELSDIVLAPVAGLLGKKRLLIVSEGTLQYVPFGVLSLPQSAENGADNRVPLIVEHDIVNLPSVSVLALLRKTLSDRQPAEKIVAVLADPVLQKDDVRIKTTINNRVSRNRKLISVASLARAAREVGISGFERLYYTRQEASAIVSQTLKGESLIALDFDASRATVNNAELERYRIIHFATHGILNSQHPELSGIVLSLVDERGQPQEGFLQVHDICNLKLKADLVVLSACRTALGKTVEGEGLIGLVRSFMYAGAVRVVASMWDVNDEATAELMKRFYQEMLKKGVTPSSALRSAQVSIWREKRWQAPYYWAAFQLQGEW